MESKKVIQINLFAGHRIINMEANVWLPKGKGGRITGSLRLAYALNCI